ncbi:hypothetical protein IFM89_005424 [Coptis chinensis]|uniref:F-box domain-containing protein n=1 Tax=Coptis chinensis TaxID=261450 RepID=A0A835IUD9_9MAGN|nr:hypothetical protein IFM89_005424 [Coptis chinensis]
MEDLNDKHVEVNAQTYTYRVEEALHPSVGTKRRTLEFPRDIIHDIFSRLPFKSVLRLKCACKSWGTYSTCLYDYKERHSILVFMAFYLWNPSTKEYRELPEAFSKYQSKYFNVVYGFGYESTHDEYKVIRIRDGILLFANCFIGFPANCVIGSGTNLDSSKFRFLIADQLDVNAQDVQVDYAM